MRRRLPHGVAVPVAFAVATALGTIALAQGTADARRDTPAERASEAAVEAASAPSPAQTRSSPVAIDGDRVGGQRVASGGTSAGPGAACFNCHGLRGEGDGTGAFPRLAGQSAWYLLKQLEDYANGTRPNETMTPIAVRLTERERRDVAVWYASLGAPFRTPAGLDPALVQRGGRIAAVGSAEFGVQACAGCHGPAGSGVPPDVPYLAGQNPGFIELQLRLWQEGRRTNDPLGVMADVARRLPPEARRAVAAYYGSLQPPAR